MVNVRIFVTYKQSVFDPQGETIKDAIHSLGHDEINKELIGNFFYCRCYLILICV